MASGRIAYPPTIHHSSTIVSPAEAQEALAKFLKRAETKPYLHPDSQINSTGINFSAHSGPNGGLAFHHLRRIEAGLSGENLIAETEEELAKLEEPADAEALPLSDDKRLDARLQRTKEIQEWAESSTAAASVEDDTEMDQAAAKKAKRAAKQERKKARRSEKAQESKG